MCGKYSFTNLQIQVLTIVLRAEIVTTFGSKMIGISTRNTCKNIENLRTSHGYIFRILQHFATQFENFTTLKGSFREFRFLCLGFCALGNNTPPPNPPPPTPPPPGLIH